MFARFTQQPGDLPLYNRTARVQAFGRMEEGGTRIFLSGSLSCMVAEDEDDVLRILTREEQA